MAYWLMIAERARSMGAVACTSVIRLPLTMSVTCTGPHCMSSTGPVTLRVAGALCGAALRGCEAVLCGTAVAVARAVAARGTVEGRVASQAVPAGTATAAVV